MKNYLLFLTLALSTILFNPLAAMERGSKRTIDATTEQKGENTKKQRSEPSKTLLDLPVELLINIAILAVDWHEITTLDAAKEKLMNIRLVNKDFNAIVQQHALKHPIVLDRFYLLGLCHNENTIEQYLTTTEDPDAHTNESVLNSFIMYGKKIKTVSPSLLHSMLSKKLYTTLDTVLNLNAQLDLNTVVEAFYDLLSYRGNDDQIPSCEPLLKHFSCDLIKEAYTRLKTHGAPTQRLPYSRYRGICLAHLKNCSQCTKQNFPV